MAYDVLTECRAALGVTDDYFDNQISLNIAAARRKMCIGGVSEAKSNDDEDPLVLVAIITYVKAVTGNDNPYAERFLESFESLVTQMKLTDCYGKSDDDE